MSHIFDFKREATLTVLLDIQAVCPSIHPFPYVIRTLSDLAKNSTQASMPGRACFLYFFHSLFLSFFLPFFPFSFIGILIDRQTNRRSLKKKLELTDRQASDADEP